VHVLIARPIIFQPLALTRGKADSRSMPPRKNSQGDIKPWAA
jgi:hypothetical protein